MKKGAISGMIWKFSERISAELVSFVVSVILARILIPEDYSVVGIVAIFFSFSEVLISGGFNSALIQKKDVDETDYSSVMLLSLAISGVVYFILFFCAGWISRIYKQDLIVPVLRVMGLVLFINAYKSVLSAYVSNRLEFKKYFASTIGGTVVSAIVGIIMAYKGFGPWALVAQQMTNSLIDTLILSVTTGYKPAFRISFKRLKSLFDYGGKIYLSSIISVIYDEIKPLIVGIRFSGTDLAFYNKGESFPRLLNASISDTISAVLFPVISKVQDEAESVRNMTRRFIGITSFIVFPMMVGLMVIADNFVIVILTEKWIPIVPYIRIFCFSYMFNIIQVANLQAIKAIGRSDIFLKLEIIKKLSYLGIILGFVLLSSSPVILAMSTIVTTIVSTIANTYPNRKLIGYRYRYQIMDLLPNLISSIVMGIGVYFLGLIQIDKLVVMIIQIVSGIAIYYAIGLISKNRNLRFLLDIVGQYSAGIRKRGKGGI